MTTKRTTRGVTSASGRTFAAFLSLVLPPGLLAYATLLAAVIDDRFVSGVLCFEPARFDAMCGGLFILAVVMAVSAVAFLFVAPGLLATLAFTRLRSARRTAHVWSLLANSAALILVCLILRNTVGIDRLSLAAAWLAWTVALFVLGWRPGQSPAILSHLARRYGGALIIALVTVAAAAVVFFPEQFLQCFNEDGTETYELARSLRGHFLPCWELETWQWQTGNRLGTVVVNPSLVNSYWTCALQTLLGDNELATRLPYWVWWLAIFAVACRLVRPRGRRGPSLVAVLALALLMMLNTLLFTFYVGYNPYMADIANPGVPDTLLTLAVLVAFDCLRQRDGRGFVVSMVLASLVLYAGAVILATTLVAAWIWRPIPRREVVRWGLRALGLLLAIAAIYLAWGWREGSLPAWLESLDLEYVNDYLAPVPLWQSGPVFFGYFLLGCGVVPALGLVWAFRRGPWERTVATAALLYLLVVLSSGAKNLHYLGPLWPIPLVLFLVAKAAALRRADAQLRTLLAGGDLTLSALRRLLPGALLLGSLMLCIVLCWPKARNTFTLNRDLGARTTIATDSYLAAAQWARLRLTLIEEEKVGWYFDQHTWVAYSRLDAALARPRPLVLTADGPPSPQYILLAARPIEGSRDTARLYVSGPQWSDWLKRPQPLRPLDRYPLVMRPIADGRFAPHNNALEDVQHLRWPW